MNSFFILFSLISCVELFFCLSLITASGEYFFHILFLANRAICCHSVKLLEYYPHVVHVLIVWYLHTHARCTYTNYSARVKWILLSEQYELFHIFTNRYQDADPTFCLRFPSCIDWTLSFRYSTRTMIDEWRLVTAGPSTETYFKISSIPR